MINPMDLSGRHILVTGASRGIGKAVCILAAKLGAKVTLAARNEEALRETVSMMEGEGHEAVAVDLAQEDSAEYLVKEVVARGGKLDGVVHCAGITIDAPLKMAKPEKAKQVIEISYIGFLSLLRMAGNKKYGNDGASIVGISSVAALHGSKSQGIYSASKAAIMGLTAPAAKELAGRKIRVNNVVFGMVKTDMYEGFLREGGDNGVLLTDQYLGVLEPEDAANGICFLLSDAARMITGTSMVIDGGFLS